VLPVAVRRRSQGGLPVGRLQLMEVVDMLADITRRWAILANWV
jgi:hypothetical protein